MSYTDHGAERMSGEDRGRERRARRETKAREGDEKRRWVRQDQRGRLKRKNAARRKREEKGTNNIRR